MSDTDPNAQPNGEMPPTLADTAVNELPTIATSGADDAAAAELAAVAGVPVDPRAATRRRLAAIREQMTGPRGADVLQVSAAVVALIDLLSADL